MPFCVNCGEELLEDWIACPKCGTVREQKNNTNPSETREKNASSDRGLGVISHFFGVFSGFFFPVLIYVIKGDSLIKIDPLLHSHIKESVNASVTFSIALFSYFLLAPLLSIELAIIVSIFHTLFQAICALEASYKLRKGFPFRYPISMQIV